MATKSKAAIKKRKLARVKRTYNRELARYRKLPRVSQWCWECGKIEEPYCDWCKCDYKKTCCGKHWTYNMKARIVVHTPDSDNDNPEYPHGECFAAVVREYNLKPQDFLFGMKPSEGNNDCQCRGK